LRAVRHRQRVRALANDGFRDFLHFLYMKDISTKEN
jgi:hypothetical protein